MEEVASSGMDLPKRSFQIHGPRADGVGSVRQGAEPWEAADLSRLAAALHGGAGGDHCASKPSPCPENWDRHTLSSLPHYFGAGADGSIL